MPYLDELPRLTDSLFGFGLWNSLGHPIRIGIFASFPQRLKPPSTDSRFVKVEEMGIDELGR